MRMDDTLQNTDNGHLEEVVLGIDAVRLSVRTGPPPKSDPNWALLHAKGGLYHPAIVPSSLGFFWCGLFMMRACTPEHW